MWNPKDLLWASGALNNPNDDDDDQEYTDELMLSMKQKGWLDSEDEPVTLTHELGHPMITDGNHRAVAAEAAGIESIPVHEVDAGDEDSNMERTASNWTTCSAGHTHWGPNGAAGMLFRHTDEVGTKRFLLQERGDVHHAGTWSIPGGAIDQGETPHQAAARESSEEIGPTPPHTVDRVVASDCGAGWRYHTVVADVPEMFEPGSGGWESASTRWVTADEAKALPLHPGFRDFIERERIAAKDDEFEEYFNTPEHDYDPSWDYDVDPEPHPDVVAAVERARPKLEETARYVGMGKPSVHYIRGGQGVATYARGTAPHPVLMIDSHQHVDPEVDLEHGVHTSLFHEFGHGIEDWMEREPNEDVVEDYARDTWDNGHIAATDDFMALFDDYEPRHRESRVATMTATPSERGGYLVRGWHRSQRVARPGRRMTGCTSAPSGRRATGSTLPTTGRATRGSTR